MPIYAPQIRKQAANQAPYDTALDQYATERNLVPFLTQVYDHEKAARRDFWHSILERITITHYEKGFNEPKEFDIHFRT